MENTQENTQENTIEFIKEQRRVSHANYKKKCAYCGREFECVRIDAKFCTPLCRVKYHKEGGTINAIFDNSKEEVDKSNAYVKGYRNFDFKTPLSDYPPSDEWIEFRNYLQATFGWNKKSTQSLKQIERKVKEWNTTHREQINFVRKPVTNADTGRIISRIIFSVIYAK